MAEVLLTATTQLERSSRPKPLRALSRTSRAVEEWTTKVISLGSSLSVSSHLDSKAKRWPLIQCSSLINSICKLDCHLYRTRGCQVVSHRCR